MRKVDLDVVNNEKFKFSEFGDSRKGKYNLFSAVKIKRSDLFCSRLGWGRGLGLTELGFKSHSFLIKKSPEVLSKL